MSDFKVTLADYMGTIGCCSNGARNWCKSMFGEEKGLKFWEYFRNNGVMASKLQKYDHVLIKRVIETARIRCVKEGLIDE